MEFTISVEDFLDGIIMKSVFLHMHESREEDFEILYAFTLYINHIASPLYGLNPLARVYNLGRGVRGNHNPAIIFFHINIRALMLII